MLYHHQSRSHIRIILLVACVVQRLGRRSNATKVKQRTLWSLNGWVAAVAKSAGAANCGVVAGRLALLRIGGAQSWRSLGSFEAGGFSVRLYELGSACGTGAATHSGHGGLASHVPGNSGQGFLWFSLTLA